MAFWTERHFLFLCKASFSGLGFNILKQVLVAFLVIQAVFSFPFEFLPVESFKDAFTPVNPSVAAQKKCPCCFGSFFEQLHFSLIIQSEIEPVKFFCVYVADTLF